jgi:hypothetical protein
MQGAVRSTFKLYYREVLKIREQGTATGEGGMLTTIEGEESIAVVEAPIANKISTFIRKARNKDEILDRGTLNKLDVFSTSYDHDSVVAVLRAFSKDLDKKEKSRKVTELYLNYLYEYLSSEGVFRAGAGKEDFTAIIMKARAIIMSSRTENGNLLKMKKYVNKLISKNTKKKDKQILASVRNAVLLYIFIRTHKG